jgi:predicted nucleotidyltransferase
VSWATDPLVDRHAQRERLLALARGHVQTLAGRLPVIAAVVAGSVCRGDFNQWSDVDLVVVVEDLPADAAQRWSVLSADRPGRVEVHGYTPSEFQAALERRDALALETSADGLVLGGRLPGKPVAGPGDLLP